VKRAKRMKIPTEAALQDVLRAIDRPYQKKPYARVAPLVLRLQRLHAANLRARLL